MGLWTCLWGNILSMLNDVEDPSNCGQKPLIPRQGTLDFLAERVSKGALLPVCDLTAEAR